LDITRLGRNALPRYSFPRLTSAGACNAVSTRLGGVSIGPFASLNLGHAVGDDGQVVEANRVRLYDSLGAYAGCVVTSHQTHSTNVARVTGRDAGRGALTPSDIIPDTDALITDNPGLFLFLRFADCVPLFFCDPLHEAVGLAHAGWKGTAANMAGVTVAAMRAAFGSEPQHLLAAIGPCIGVCHYEIQEDVAQQIRSALPHWQDVLQAGERGLMLDLAEANRRQLMSAGLSPQNIADAGLCTACHTDEFYSHRAEKGKTGRFGAMIAWAKDGLGHG
jgi:polyphenol oxidase